MAMSEAPHAARPEGLAGSLRRLGRSLLAVLQTRFEILSADIAEERFNLVRVAVVALGALFCFQVGVFLAVLFVVLAASDQNRLAVIGGVALVLLLAAAGAVLWLRHWLKTRPPLFAATIAELRKDRDRIGGGS
jgi:uncharacterized membrane protein YqjE